MLVLVLDTATPAVTAALVRVDSTSAVEVLAERVTVDARAHGELLGPQVEAVLAVAGVRVVDLAAVVAGTGPGPFTGLRVGLVTAAALGQAGGIPTYGVCSLDGIGAGTTGRVLVATDARRREVYWAGYTDGVRVAGPGVGRPAELVTEGFEYAVGAAAESLPLPVRAEPRYPVAWELAALAAERVHSGAPSEGLTPLYLRRPDAVEPTGRKLVRQ
jgi:tRNA threonylcarbamoyl adenosine modification protein YeaZ